MTDKDLCVKISLQSVTLKNRGGLAVYVQRDIWIEDICYEHAHIQQVLQEIAKNFDGYFAEFIDSTGGTGISYAKFAALQKSMGLDERITQNGRKSTKVEKYRKIVANAIDEFEKDRQSYIDLLDEENLEEDGDDVAAFKAKTLRHECPIIRLTLYSPVKELDKYKKTFNLSDPQQLYDVVKNLRDFAYEYAENIYDSNAYDGISSYEELNMSRMDSDECTVYGVIGGGIRSHLVYKLYPGLFPNRSRAAIWALWYLSGKNTFSCNMDSEFLMIDIDKATTQQNYNYPYELFSYYAHELYKMLKAKATELETDIPDEYRYVVVDSFLSFVAGQHEDEITLFKSQIRDGGFDYA